MNCEKCVIKHLSQCLVLIVEYQMGYDCHYYYIIGHMAEAERECFEKYPITAKSIRALRNAFLDDKDMIPDIMSMLSRFVKVVEECGTGTSDGEPSDGEPR